MEDTTATAMCDVSGHRARVSWDIVHVGLWLVVLGGVELEFSEQFAVGGQDPDVEVVDQDEDVFAGVAAADSDVVQPAVVAQREHTAGVDAVVPGPVVAGVEGDPGGDGLGARARG
jgi:hypothetical protein